MTGARTDAVLLVALTIFEAGSLGALATAAGHGRIFTASLAVAAIAAAVAAWRVGRGLSSDRRSLGMTVAMNVLTAGLAFGAAEVGLRVSATRLPHGIFVGNRLLLPRSWERVASYNRSLLRNAPSNISYFVADERLGWTIGPSRVSRDGLYASSAEGIRSDRAGVAYASSAPPHRIAIVGDSYTFGLEVPFAQSWGRLLEERLGDGFQVLNFGVDGYGVDQAYLRYDRDARPLAPRVVVCGFIRHDLQRTMAVYPFIDFPTWGFPYAKPRLTRTAAGALEARNVPLTRPEAIFGARSIEALPFLDLDAGYRASQWRARPYAASFVLRFLLSGLETQGPAAGPVSESEMIALNAEILATLARNARDDGAIPIVVFFPSRFDFRPGGGDGGRLLTPLFEALRARDVEALDMTSCLSPLGEDALFLPGRPHYSPRGNAALAECLLPSVRSASVR
jgi:hypothetical protein